MRFAGQIIIDFTLNRIIASFYFQNLIFVLIIIEDEKEK